MTTWNPRANELFLQALELGSAAERQHYLDGACGPDAALRAEVESLLEASARAGSFLASPVAAPQLVATVDEQPAVERLGTVIGSYKLLEQIGEGGFGIVFMAEQTQPVRRKVALKVLKPGMDTRQVVARFEAERQALALMDHPNIARVFDGGETAGGRPYVVMELVRGVPITRFCDEEHLAVRDRLELFVCVCQAVQHAHQKGVIHRDLKPSNVLVTLHDTTPVVKVIDFGIAKALGQSLTDKTLFTGFAQMIGTPLYMSPEQAGMSGLDVDTRSDVYSLGVLLYELLTGTTPFDQERLKQADHDELRRIIREEEPPRPSTRISTLGQEAPTVSANRKSDPRRLSHVCRGELDWVVMKALEKDRNRRYESASAFAADVQRYLADEPVQACPPSTWYRFRKFARRNKASLAIAAASALVMVLAVVGLAVNNWMVSREKTRADRNLERARDAVKQYFTLVSEDPDLKAKGLEPLRRRLLAAAREYYSEFVREHGNEPALRAEFAEAHMRLASITEEIADKGKAIEEYEQALVLCRQLVDSEPGVTAHRVLLGRVHGSLGKLYWAVGRFEDAKVAYQKAVAIQEQLAREHPDSVRYRRDLAASLGGQGNVYSGIGRTDDAEAAYRKDVELWRQLVTQHPSTADYQSGLATSLTHLGDLFATTKRAPEGEKVYEKALIVQRQLVQAHPDIEDYQDCLATCQLNLGRLYLGANRLKEAESATTSARDIWQKLADVHPNIVMYQHNLAASHNNLSTIYGATGRPKEDAASQQKALAIRRRLAGAHPAVIEFSVELGGSQCNLGNRARDAGRLAEALEWYSQAVATLEGVLRREELHATARTFLAKTHLARGEALGRLDRHADAVAAFTAALRLDPGVPEVHCNLGFALRALGRFDESLIALKRGHELGLKKTTWSYPSAQWVRDGERLAQFDRELAELRRGEAPPADAQERIGLAEFCIMYKRMPATGLRLWTALFADGFPRAEQDRAIQMYNAACAAALASTGNGLDVGQLSNAERARWRKHAMDWLLTALEVWRKRVEKVPPAECTAIEKRMKLWQESTELDSLRDEAVLSKLPKAQQVLCRKLWTDVAALRARARVKANNPEQHKLPRK